MIIEAHTYQNILDAWTALAQINANQGIPTSPTAETTTYTNVMNYGNFYYIIADDITKSILGLNELQNIEIQNNENF